MLIRQCLKIPLTKQEWTTVCNQRKCRRCTLEKCWQFFINIKCLRIAFKSCTKQGVSIFNVGSPLVWVLCIGKWAFSRFMVAPASTGCVTGTVQTSGVINLIKEPHMDAQIHHQETREWWEYFNACLSFNLSQWWWEGGVGVGGYRGIPGQGAQDSLEILSQLRFTCNSRMIRKNLH